MGVFCGPTGCRGESCTRRRGCSQPACRSGRWLGGRGPQVLDVLERDPLLEQVGDDVDPEGVRTQDRRQTGVLQPSLDQAADRIRGEGPGRETTLSPVTLVLRSAKEGTRRVSRVEAAALHVFGEPAVEIDPDGDLPPHPSLLVEPEGAVLAIVAETLHLQALNGSHGCAGIGQCPDHGAIAETLHLQALNGSHGCAGIGQCPDHGAIAETDEGRAVDRREEAARLLHGDRGGLALQCGAPWPADGEEGIQGDGVACDQEVEEVAERGERLLLRRGGAVEVVDEAGGVPWSDLPELELPGFAPDEEPADDAAVRPPRMRIRDGGGEFVGSEPAARLGR